MKKILLLGGVFWLSLFATSCSNDNDVETPTSNGGQQVSIKANIADGKDLRVAYNDNGSSMKATWSENEKFTMYQGTSNAGQEFSNSADDKNTFNGTAPTGTGNYYGVYGNNITNTDGVLTVDISSQTGTAAENGITEFMIAESENLESDFKFEHKLAVLKLNLEFPEEVSGKIEKVTVMGFHNKASYTLADSGSYTYAAADIGDIIATNGETGFTIGDDHKITAYIAVFPEKVFECNATIKVEVGADTYLYTIQATRELTAGKVVPVGVKMVKLEYVDLGLSVKWANMNVGANKPEQYGGRYAWGETVNKETCSRDTYMCTSSDCGGDNDPLKDYVTQKTSIAGTDYDVAHVKWGGTWKMPTKEQIEELKDSCNWQWDKTDKYYKVMNKSDNTKFIILPAAGYRDDSSTNREGIKGYYWSATPRSYDTLGAYYLYFYFDGDEIGRYSAQRWYGYSVRPVSE